MKCGWLAHPLTRGIDIDAPELISLRRRVAREKIFLRRIYEEWYAEIAGAIPGGAGRVLELGSGCGFFEEFVPDAITSEVQTCPHVRIVMDGQILPFTDRSLRAVVMTDVLHHLPDARRFLREAARCVRPGGRLVMVEPWVSAWSSFIYKRLHHEPFLPDAAQWEFPKGGPLSSANMALPWIMFVRDQAQFTREFPEWRVVTIRPTMPFRYLLSGGVSLRGLVPKWTFGAWRALERLVRPWNEHLAMFAFIALERSDVD